MKCHVCFDRSSVIEKGKRVVDTHYSIMYSILGNSPHCRISFVDDKTRLPSHIGTGASVVEGDLVDRAVGVDQSVVGEVHRATPRDSFCVLLVLQRLYNMLTCPAWDCLWQYFKKCGESCIRLPHRPPLALADHSSHRRKPNKRKRNAWWSPNLPYFATSLTQQQARKSRHQ
jgi:hypothetical protein